MSLFANLKAFITGHVWPFLENLGKGVVQAEINSFKPQAEATVAKLAAAVTSAKSTSEMGQALAAIIVEATAQAGTDAISVGASAILAGIGTALAANTDTATQLSSSKP